MACGEVTVCGDTTGLRSRRHWGRPGRRHQVAHKHAVLSCLLYLHTCRLRHAAAAPTEPAAPTKYVSGRLEMLTQMSGRCAPVPGRADPARAGSAARHRQLQQTRASTVRLLLECRSASHPQDTSAAAVPRRPAAHLAGSCISVPQVAGARFAGVCTQHALWPRAYPRCSPSSARLSHAATPTKSEVLGSTCTVSHPYYTAQ